jgi:hypothetical protein
MKHAIAIAFAAVLVLVACGGDTGDQVGATDVPRVQDATQSGVPGNAGQACQADGDCPVGTGCAASAGVCVAFPPWAMAFSVQADPDPAGALLGDQFTSLTIDTTGALDLSLAAPVVVQGRVFHAPAGGAWTGNGDAPASPASDADLAAGRLVAVATGRVPGTQFRSEAAVQAFDATASDAPRFSLRLLPNLAYQVTFIPGSGVLETLPPFSFPLQVGADVTMDVVLPPDASYMRLQGVVRQVVDAGHQPVTGAQVAGKVGTDRIGTSTLTDAQGVFVLILPPGAGAVDITVSAGRSPPLFPTRHFLWTGGLDALQADYATTPFLTLDVDPVPEVRTVSVQIFGGEGLDTTVPQARVTAVGTAGNGDFTAATTTDAFGVGTMDLLEGTYTLAITPPPESPWAASVRTLDLLTQDSPAFQIQLGPRVPVTGHVLRAATGLPVADAVVSLMTNRQAAMGAVAQAGATEAVFEATTDSGGAFSVAVDPGQYALVVSPPARTGFPRVAYPSLDLTAAHTLDVSLPEGALVRGRIRAASDGTPLASVSVRLFFPVSAESAQNTWSLGDTSFASTLQTAAEGRTDANGVYDVVVPVVAKDAKWLTPDGVLNGDPATADFCLPALDVQ